MWPLTTHPQFARLTMVKLIVIHSERNKLELSTRVVVIRVCCEEGLFQQPANRD